MVTSVLKMICVSFPHTSIYNLTLLHVQIYEQYMVFLHFNFAKMFHYMGMPQFNDFYPLWIMLISSFSLFKKISAVKILVHPFKNFSRMDT